MFFRMVYKSQCTRVTHWQTDGRTDRRTEFSSQYYYRVCITCSAVKTWQLTTHEQDGQGWLSTHSDPSKEKKQQLLGLYIYIHVDV